MAERIIVNLTEDDLNDSFEPAAPGWYHVEIDEVELKESKSQKNPGKPFYSLKYKSVDEDKFKGKFFDNVMLWNGAHFSLVGLAKALGLIESAGELVVPTEDELIGKELLVKVAIEDYVNRDGEDAKRNSVKAYKALDGAGAPKKGAAKKKQKFDI